MTHRISINIDKDQHKQLKVYCAQLGLTVKEFVLASINERMNMCWLSQSIKEGQEVK